MASGNTPPTMRAWQFSSARGGLPQNLKLNPQAQPPKPTPSQHLVKVHAVGLNPVDYKVCENSLASAILIKKPAIPGIDFSGTIVKPAEGSGFKAGDRVFGCGKSPFAGGMLAEYGTVEKGSLVLLPSNMSAVDGAAVGTAALTAYQSIKPNVKSGDRIFINGGSGGCGLWGIQLAKALGVDVTVSCSSRNLETCKSFGASEALDYTQGTLLEKLIKSSEKKKYDLIVDNIFGDIQLYWKAHNYTNEGALYQIVGSAPTLRSIFNTMKIAIIPGFLGGGKRKAQGFFAKTAEEDLGQISRWILEEKAKPPIDSVFDFEQSPQAYEKLKTSRAVGKIIVNVASSS